MVQVFIVVDFSQQISDIVIEESIWIGSRVINKIWFEDIFEGIGKNHGLGGLD